MLVNTGVSVSGLTRAKGLGPFLVYLPTASMSGRAGQVTDARAGQPGKGDAWGGARVQPRAEAEAEAQTCGALAVCRQSGCSPRVDSSSSQGLRQAQACAKRTPEHETTENTSSARAEAQSREGPAASCLAWLRPMLLHVPRTDRSLARPQSDSTRAGTSILSRLWAQYVYMCMSHVTCNNCKELQLRTRQVL